MSVRQSTREWLSMAYEFTLDHSEHLGDDLWVYISRALEHECTLHQSQTLWGTSVKLWVNIESGVNSWAGDRKYVGETVIQRVDLKVRNYEGYNLGFLSTFILKTETCLPLTLFSPATLQYAHPSTKQCCQLFTYETIFQPYYLTYFLQLTQCTLLLRLSISVSFKDVQLHNS